MKIAVLINGELRFKNNDDLNKFKYIFREFDIFISTYKKFKKEAELLSDKILYVNDNLKLRRHEYQWYHLNNILKNFKNELLEYYCIVRMRTDILMEKLSLSYENFSNLEENTLYTKTDWIFYGLSKHFYYCFENFYKEIYNNYNVKNDVYIPINYNNILKSDLVNGFIKWWVITLPSSMHNYDLKKINKIKVRNRSNEDKVFLDICFKKFKNNIIEKKYNNLNNLICLHKDFKTFTSIREFYINIINNSIIKSLSFDIHINWDTRLLYH